MDGLPLRRLVARFPTLLSDDFISAYDTEKYTNSKPRTKTIPRPAIIFEVFNVSHLDKVCIIVFTPNITIIFYDLNYKNSIYYNLYFDE